MIRGESLGVGLDDLRVLVQERGLDAVYGMAGLSEQEARAIDLYCQGYSEVMIARAMERRRGNLSGSLSLGAVKQFKSRALRKLTRLGQEAEEFVA